MNEMMKVAGFSVLGAMIALALRGVHREAGRAAALGAGLTLLIFAVSRLSPAAEGLRSLSQRSGLPEGAAALLMKLVAMAYLTEFAAQTCRDAGEEGLAMKAALCGRALLLAQTVPLVLQIGDLALSLTP